MPFPAFDWLEVLIMRIVGGTAGSRTILAPKGNETRPTLDRVRENLFNILRDRTEDAKVLDLFAGSGALSLEAISRGARSAVLVDRDREANLVEKKNAEALGFADRTIIIRADWKKALAGLRISGRTFDLVFLDPPYRMTDLTDVTGELLPFLDPGATVVIEHETGREPLVCGQLERTDERKWGFASVGFYRPTVPCEEKGS